MKRIIIFGLAFLSIFVACRKTESNQSTSTTSTTATTATTATTSTTSTTSSTEIKEGSLKVNEFVVKGSTQQNEFGTASDWFEIYNPNLTDVVLEADKWFVTDDKNSKEKAKLPAMTIPARGFLVIWCDDTSVVVKDVHVKYKLSSTGGDLGIYYKSSNGIIPIDLYTYSTITSTTGTSYGRIPDGTGEFVTCKENTPGKSNN